MKFKSLAWQAPLALGLLSSGLPAAEAAGFVTLSQSGSTVLANCNPNNSSSVSTCSVTSLPGESGYNQFASRTTPIVINDITVGTLYEKVWRNCADSTLYIFGTSVTLNNSIWDGSGVPFNVNDLFRRALPDQAVSVAYYLNGAATAQRVAGRTLQGVGEYTGSQPLRDNTWADSRVNANGAGNAAAQKSPWVLVKTKAPTGIAVDPFGIRALNSAVADITELFASGYQPNGLPSGGDD